MQTGSATLTTEKDQSIPDLVQTAWRTEGRIKALEITSAPTMTDLRDVRIQVQELTTELHEMKVEVMALVQEQRGLVIDFRSQGFELRHMKTEIHALTHEQRRMNAEIQGMNAEIQGMNAEIQGMKGELGRHSVILNALVDHFGLTIPTTASETSPQDEG